MSSDSAEGRASRSDALAALARARDELAHGSVERGWDACMIAAGIGRELGDASLITDAATLIPGPQLGSHHMTTARQALCVEALGMLDPGESARRRRLEHYLAALSGGWTETPAVTGVPLTEEQADSLILELRAAHAAAMAPDRLAERLEIATRLRDTALAAHRDADTAWGMLWRLDALAQFGRRIELNADFIELVGVIRRLDSPQWHWRVATIRSVLALLDDDIDDVPALTADAARLGANAGVEEAAFIDLIVRSDLALRTGEGLPGIDEEVRHALTDAPFLAQGWRAGILIALGKIDDALEIWRALAPHVDEVPPTAMEWLLAATTHAELSIIARDRPAAAHLYEMLGPHGHLHVIPTVMSPYSGPVALYLGDLAAFLGRSASARTHYEAALSSSQDMHAPAFSRRAREAIARLGAPTSPHSPRSTLSPLSLREAEVAELIGAGMTNREVAHRLFLSERTVENHVSNILHRLGLPNRAAVAAWVSRQNPA
ncbi:LuxR C-terminal-related transcriptional regulator [Cryobacterium sp. SO1]|uniref:helix-turn-helix transcriptional regulator n=1 Tax=Cryobacterium sp. SO1 TaxID=1897061 RepID=UPI001022F19E|nr:LuxR C-terminal-related transcriptional regulator [Cryobacterium sp. SO1]RZI35577.1 Spore germination protein GerE [Cryobacterium sp. SO1]